MQIIGTASCRNTKKCRLWFDQRGISYHFVNLSKRSLSDGELQAIAQGREWDDLIDRDSKAWKKLQLEWKAYNPMEELSEEQGLLKTPILREGRTVVVGYDVQAWEAIAQRLKPS